MIFSQVSGSRSQDQESRVCWSVDSIREHQYLNQDSEWSLQPIEQIRRWTQFLRQVETARLSSTCHIIGDFNLDYMKWDAPDFAHLQMITDTKNSLEAGGFFQLVTDVTSLVARSS